MEIVHDLSDFSMIFPISRYRVRKVRESNRDLSAQQVIHEYQCAINVERNANVDCINVSMTKNRKTECSK